MSGGFRSRSSGRRDVEQQRQPHGGRGAKKRSGRAQARPRKHEPQQQRRGHTGVDEARLAAFDVLQRVSTNGAYANLTLPNLLRERKIKGRDAAFATELTYGTLRTLGVLDAVIGQCSSRSLDQIAPEVLDALRLGAYQLLYTRVEPHAAVDTSVRLVDEAGQGKAKGFANGILRAISRTKPEAWIEKLTPDGELAAVAFRTAHPEWIAASFSRVLGLGELEEALRADSERPVVHLVARPGEISAEELALITGGETGTYSPYAVYLEEGDPGQLQPVREGMAAVQDEGSQIIARAVTEVPVESDSGRWLDLCAGPGGKAALMGSLALIDGAHVDAVEISPHRADLIRKTVSGQPVTVHVADGRDPGLEPGFDRVLVDAPCSGLGSLRRRPEARWRKKESDIVELTVLQEELLRSAVNLVKPGGVVVYSTCSPDLRETRGVVDKLLASGEVTEEDAHEYTGGMDHTGDNASVQMWPHRHGTDAMFFSVLRKI
ncbi:RsmB/NOP family class I SAM-dependent RNA methyltransferase [Corynebacterium cystitidis]|uniref:RsmB/NOP family class I SAM-dependent RNA methyltransferase n=1 Tax=Corynebacterium cystitidis TaxID=35757 RepID=UPI00211E91BE|nr:transcription antitermination factor NusB [Corynebacterium cystitidis]